MKEISELLINDNWGQLKDKIIFITFLNFRINQLKLFIRNCLEIFLLKDYDIENPATSKRAR